VRPKQRYSGRADAEHRRESGNGGGVETPLLAIVLPADNIFGLPAGAEGLSVAHGWVTPVNPLTPGTHTIVIGGTTTTTIVVSPDR
jgi:hypothetical protein